MTLLTMLPDASAKRLSEAFHHTVVSYFPHIRKNVLFREEVVEGLRAEIFRGDYHGLLLQYGVPYEHNRIITEFNGFASTLDYPGLPGMVKIINPEFLDNLFTTFLTRRK